MISQHGRSKPRLLREGKFLEADVEHIAEELAGMGRTERREAWSQLSVLLMHLAKWQAQPEPRETSTWKSTMRAQRRELQRLVRFSPQREALHQAEILQEVYEEALRDAAIETSHSMDSLPRECPFTLEQLLDVHFLP